MPDGSTQYQAYLDPAGIWTVCHGVTGPGVVARQWYTQQQCDALESAAYKKAEEGAKRLFIHFNTYNRWMQGDDQRRQAGADRSYANHHAGGG